MISRGVRGLLCFQYVLVHGGGFLEAGRWCTRFGIRILVYLGFLCFCAGVVFLCGGQCGTSPRSRLGGGEVLLFRVAFGGSGVAIACCGNNGR